MKPRLMILDSDIPAFAEVLCCTRHYDYSEYFTVYTSFNQAEAIRLVRELEIDILLTSPAFQIDPGSVPGRCLIVYVVDSPRDFRTTYRDIVAVGRYDATPERLHAYICGADRQRSSAPRGDSAPKHSFAPRGDSAPKPSFASRGGRIIGSVLGHIGMFFFPTDLFRLPKLSEINSNMEELRSDSRNRAEQATCRANRWADLSQVQFRCAAPMTIKPGRYFTARIMMLREDDADRARELAGELGDKVRMASGGDTLEAETGQEFTIRLQSPDLPELDEMQKIRWNGRHAFRDFQILLPGGYDREQLRLLGRVYSHDIPMTDIRLILEVSSPMPQEVRCEKLRLRTAFVSYASKDRAEVAKRLQMLERLRPDMDVFMDRNNLNYGEEYEPRLYREIRDRDLFFLFWSHNAAASEWVNKELTYALEHKPMTRIEPVWLEKIDHCPPPEQLRHLHFWDWTQNYMED